MPRCSAFLICLSYRLYPIRPCGAPSPRGEGCDTRIPSSKKAAKPPPYKPSPHGVNGARVLSLAAQMRPFSPSFLWKEVPRRGGGWPRVTVLPHSRKPTPPRFARLPLPEEGARMIFKETRIQSLSFAVSDSRSPTCAALFRFPHLSFIPPVPYPPLRGTFPSRGRRRYENTLF